MAQSANPVAPHRKPEIERALAALSGRSVVLIGMMGAGKTTIGRRLASVLGLPFADADHEIEKAAGMTIAEIFEGHGEAYFRDGERRVIARLLGEGQKVLATGGGAFMDPETRATIGECAVSVWLRGDLPLLLKRVSRRANRPLIQSEPEAVMKRLMAQRAPTYAIADLTVDARDEPHDSMVGDILERLKAQPRKGMPDAHAKRRA